MEADVAMSGVLGTEVLMAFSKDNTSEDKDWIFDSGNSVHVCFHKQMFNFLVTKKGLSTWWMDRLARSLPLRKSRLQKEIGQCVL